MAKILLVEDDNNLREIYEARLQAEGYAIVSAKDGEEALVLAKSEHPDLIISDVMMPRVSGFEMLDILRNTEGLKDVKIIMLTALGQAEDKTRADALGADKYLVKSQVTLEDIVKTAEELLNQNAAPGAATATVTPAAAPQPTPVAATPVSVTPAPVAAGTPTTAAPTTPGPAVPVTAPVPAAAPPVVAPVMPAPAPSAAAPPPATPTAPAPAPNAPAAATVPVRPAPAPTTAAPRTAPAAPQPSAAAPTPEPLEPLPSAIPIAAPASAASAPTTSAPVAPPSAAAPQSDTAPVTPPSAETSVSPALTQSTSNEEATVQAQIDKFVAQPTVPPSASPAAVPPSVPLAPPVALGEPAPQPPETPPPDTQATDQLVADAVKNLSSAATTEPAQPAALTPAASLAADPGATVTPTLAAAPVAAEPEKPSDDDAVTVAHKKVIKPINDPAADSKPDLNELLAREGIDTLGDHQDQAAPAPQPGALAAYSTPHPPGHVISPSATTAANGVDPNSIAL